MAFLFGKTKKTPQELLKAASQGIEGFFETPADEKNQKKNSEKLSETLSSMKFMMYGDGDNEPKKENIDKLCEGLLQSPLLLDLLKHMKQLDFEARKDVSQIYNYILRQRHVEAIKYVEDNPIILELLVKGYEDSDIALNCGSILRECIRHQPLAEMIMTSPPGPLFLNFFQYVQVPTFDVASDAFATFKTLLTKHKAYCSKFLEKNFKQVFDEYNALLESKNYVTKRQSLKLLGELLLDRSNFKIMMLYINDPNNLKIMMNLLRGHTKAIQFEAFHVFKIFVANPKKSPPIVDILLRNREKLVEFLKKFQAGNKVEEQFAEEKRILLAALQKLDASALPTDEAKQAQAAPPAVASATPKDGAPPQ